MKIVVIGANGQLGSDISIALRSGENDVVDLTHDDIEIADIDSVAAVLRELRPDVVVNTAAMHNLDACEEDPVRSFEVNGLGAANLAAVAGELDASLVHISTDYVFDGEKAEPYVETDCPRPLNVYGSTKLSGEYFIRSALEKHSIVRVSGLYGTNPCRAKRGMNFVKVMLKLAGDGGEVRVVDDEVLTPTYTVDVANQIKKIIDSGHGGLFHATAEGSCSWYGFAAKIFEIAGMDVNLSVAAPGEFSGKVKRPKYSVLKNLRLQSLNIDVMPPWEDGLRRYLHAIL